MEATVYIVLELAFDCHEPETQKILMNHGNRNNNY